MSPESTAAGHERFRIALSFALVYVLWGSTYLAMRVAVRDVEPFVLGTTRYLISGPIMLAVCALTGRKIGLSLSDGLKLLAIGVLLLSIGNMGVVWGEKYVPSGLTALVVAIVPIWVVALEAWVFRAGHISRQGLAGLAIGIAGLIVLLWPRITSGTLVGRLELMGCGILAVGSLSWALGSVLYHRWTLRVEVLTACAWQMTFAGLVNAVLAGATGEFGHSHWTTPALLSVTYLVVCGSWIGYTAYIWLLEHIAPPKVATYAYVNPIVAVLLGWLLLSERVDGFMMAGTVIIIAAVALVNTSKLERPGINRDAEVNEIGAVRVGGD
ncbi:MAG TPA: EamA family transporter [Terriglobales bacterium]